MEEALTTEALALFFTGARWDARNDLSGHEATKRKHRTLTQDYQQIDSDSPLQDSLPR